MVYADSGERQIEVSDAMMARIASAWTGQPASAVDDRGGRARRSVDHPRRVPEFQSPEEILLAGRRAGLHLGEHRRGGAVHDHRVAPRRLRRRDPALALLHPAAEARVRMEPAGHLVLGHRHRVGGLRDRHRDLDVFAVEALSPRGSADQHSVSRPEAVAHHLRPAVRSRGSHLGIQRHALDGSVSDPDRRSDRKRRRQRR